MIDAHLGDVSFLSGSFFQISIIALLLAFFHFVRFEDTILSAFSLEMIEKIPKTAYIPIHQDTNELCFGSSEHSERESIQAKNVLSRKKCQLKIRESMYCHVLAIHSPHPHLCFLMPCCNIPLRPCTSTTRKLTARLGAGTRHFERPMVGESLESLNLWHGAGWYRTCWSCGSEKDFAGRC